MAIVRLAFVALLLIGSTARPVDLKPHQQTVAPLTDQYQTDVAHVQALIDGR